MLSGFSLWARLVRAGLVAGLIGYVILALASGIDRGAVPRLGLERSPLAARSLIVAAQEQLAKGGRAQALQLARRAVAADPVEPASTALLGAARLAAGDAAGALQAFTVAGTMGWRVPVTQLYWLDRAIAARDYRVAMLRFDALLRQDPALVAEPRVIAEFEQEPAGRRALLAVLARRPAWLPNYLAGIEGLQSGQLAARAAIVAELARMGVKVGCRPVAGLQWRLIDAGNPAAARALWLGHCPTADGALLPDGALMVLSPDQAGPFGWQIASHADLTIAREEGASGPALLKITNSGPARRLIARQMIVPAPGTYRLSWTARDAAGASSPAIAASAGCHGQSADLLAAIAEPGGTRRSALVKVAPACRALWVQFDAAPAASAVSFGSVALDRL